MPPKVLIELARISSAITTPPRIARGKIAERRFGLSIEAQTRILWRRRRLRADGDVVHCTPRSVAAAARCPVGVYLMPLYVADRYNHAKGSCGCCCAGRQPVRRSRITADGTACRMDPSRVGTCWWFSFVSRFATSWQSKQKITLGVK